MNTIYIDKATGRPVVVNAKLTFTDGTIHAHTEDSIDPNDVYLSGKTIKIRLPRPDMASRFDGATERWVRDPVAEVEQVRANRQASYPDIADQLDMLWHAMDARQIPRAEPFYSEIAAVKSRFPKPSN